MSDVIIIGGGLAGLTSSILLGRHGLKVTLLEKGIYPNHKVCGEYVSNEVIPFLKSHDLFPAEIEPVPISKFQLTAINGDSIHTNLDLGGFGISRYQFDKFLAKKATDSGVEVFTNTKVEHLQYIDEQHLVQVKGGRQFIAPLLIAAHGKRSNLDHNLSRSFIQKRSPYVGIKYHLKADLPDDLISLHNFRGGYGGISRIEDKKFNFCYLVHRDQLRKYGNVPLMEEKVLAENPHLRQLFNQAEILFDKPMVINEITFEKKEAVHNHILMAGDSAGMITPLCGNGMAMAIHSGKMAAEAIIKYYSQQGFDRNHLENEYRNAWEKAFLLRLKVGRATQRLFGSEFTSNLAVQITRNIKPLFRLIVKNTHGQPFK